MELGAKMRTTSFLLIPIWCKPLERLVTVDLRSENVRVWPESESIIAGLVEKEEELRKRNEIIERFGSLGRFNGGRSDRNMPSRP